MGAYQDLTPGLTEGLHIGAVIGSRIAQNRLEQQRLDRLFQQTQFANQITLRDQAIQEADAARKAQQFQQLADFSRLVQQTTPGGGDFNALTPDEQAQAQSTMRERQLQQLPPAFLPKALESGQSDFERQQRLDQTLKAQALRTDATQQAYDLRNQARIDEHAAEQDKRISAAVAAAEKAQQAAQSGREFTQGEITKRGAMRQKPVDEFPSGSPAAILQDLLKAKEAGAEAGAVGDAGAFTAATPHWYNSAQPIDALIEKYGAKVPPAAKRKIEAKIAGAVPEPDQTVPEPAAAPVPTETAPAIDPLPAKKSDLVKDKLYKTPNHGVLRWNGNAFEKP